MRPYEQVRSLKLSAPIKDTRWLVKQMGVNDQVSLPQHWSNTQYNNSNGLLWKLRPALSPGNNNNVKLWSITAHETINYFIMAVAARMVCFEIMSPSSCLEFSCSLAFALKTTTSRNVTWLFRSVLYVQFFGVVGLCIWPQLGSLSPWLLDLKTNSHW